MGARLELDAPPRPALTPAFLCGMAAWAACAASYRLGRELAPVVLLTCAAFFIAGVIVLVVCAAKLRIAVLFVGAALAGGAALGLAQNASMAAQADALDYECTVEAELELLEDSKSSYKGEWALARVTLDDGSSTLVIATLPNSVGKDREGTEQGSAAFDHHSIVERETPSTSDEHDVELNPIQGFTFGQSFRCTLTFECADESRSDYLWSKGAVCDAEVISAEEMGQAGLRSKLLDMRCAALARLGGEDDAHAMLQALVCGYRRNISSTPCYEAYQSCGLAHLVAVSGAHLVIVTGLFASLMKAMRAPRKLCIAVVAFTMAAYLVVAGMPISALRAAAMSLLGLFSYFGRRRPSSCNALGVGVMALLCLDPSSCVSASFALSVLSTVGIVVLSPLVSHALTHIPLMRMPFLRDALSLTIASSLASQLYACSLFDLLPLVSPVANAVSAPLFPMACASGLAAALAGIVGAPFQSAAVQLACLPVELLDALVAKLAQLPYASVPLTLDATLALALSALLALGLWALWPTGRRAGLAALAIPALLIAAAYLPLWQHQADQIVMLNVGQGDAFLVQSKGRSLLIDTGNQDSMLLDELAKLRIAHLDAVVITHADDDHCGSLDVLARSVDVGSILLAQGLYEQEDERCQALVVQAKATAHETGSIAYGDILHVGNFTARVVWPHSIREAGGNSDSVCLALDYDGDADGAADFSALFTGDAEQTELAEIIASGDVSDIDLLKYGHHGSKNALDDAQAQVLKPEIALIGVGANNRYGHPSPEALATLESVSCNVFRSDIDGQVTCHFAPDAIKVSTQNKLEELG